MVQEFHVLRCFSCQTFQVQQVKKGKKWSCKMCGEKQSLIKEYGRGTGSDCRRHVQKLNSLRGELLEVENERACTQWEKEDREDEDSFGDETQRCEQQDEAQVVNRWSKYVDQTGSGPEKEKVEEEEEEEENVYTERARFRSHDKIRKRKKGFTSKDASGHYDVSEDDDSGTGPAHQTAKGMPFQAHQHSGSFTSSPVVGHSSRQFPFTNPNSKTATSYMCDSPATSLCSKHTRVYSGLSATGGFGIGANKKPSAELTTKHPPSVPASTSSAQSSSHQKTSGTKLEAESSKWTRFLTSVSAKNELEDDDYAQMSSGVTDAEVAHLPTAPIPIPASRSTSHPNREESAYARAPLDDVPGLGNRITTRGFEKLSHYKAGIASSSPSTFTSKSAGSQSPVCLQLPPVKRLCPALSFSTLFHTDEDFDDAL